MDAPAAAAPAARAASAAADAAAASEAPGLPWALIAAALVGVIVVGALAYLIYDYFTYKKAATATAEKDRKTALAHDRYIIDKTNEVSGKLNADVTSANSKADYLKAGFSNWNSYFGETLRFTSNAPAAGAGAATAGAFRIGEVPGAPIANLELLKHTSFVGGLTARELTSERAAALCGSGANAARCIRFPDSAGDTYLTGLTPEASVVLDAPKTKVLGSLDFGDLGALKGHMGSLSLMGADVSLGNLSADGQDFNAISLNAEGGFAYGSKRASEPLDPTKILKLMTTRDGAVIVNGEGIVLTSNMEPYAMIGYDAARKAVAVAAGPSGKIVVHGDVVFADKDQVFGRIAREYAKDGKSAAGLRLTDVAGGRLTLDADVYVGDGRKLYGSVAEVATRAALPPPDAGTAPGATSGGATDGPAPMPNPPANKALLPYYDILVAVKTSLDQNKAAINAVLSDPEGTANYWKDPGSFIAKYPFMDAILKLMTYQRSEAFATISGKDAADLEETFGYFMSETFLITYSNGIHTNLGTAIQNSAITQLYLNNKEFFKARYAIA